MDSIVNVDGQIFNLKRIFPTLNYDGEAYSFFYGTLAAMKTFVWMNGEEPIRIGDCVDSKFVTHMKYLELLAREVALYNKIIIIYYDITFPKMYYNRYFYMINTNMLKRKNK